MSAHPRRPPHRLLGPLLLASALVPAAPAWAAGTELGAGELMFSAFNADEDGWSLVALIDLAPGTELFFSDNAWNGTGFASGEGFLRWTSGSARIAAGTWLRFSAIDSASRLAASAGTLERLSVPGSTLPNLSQSAETLYAYQGADVLTPQRFVAAVSTGGFAAEVGGLAGTGLQAGRTATLLPTGTDWAEYRGPRSGQVSGGEAQARLAATATTWAAETVATMPAALPDTMPLDVTPIPEPWAPVAALMGLAVLAAHRAGGIRSAPQAEPFEPSDGERRRRGVTSAA
jgi:hypothetical protein